MHVCFNTQFEKKRKLNIVLSSRKNCKYKNVQCMIGGRTKKKIRRIKIILILKYYELFNSQRHVDERVETFVFFKRL